MTLLGAFHFGPLPGSREANLDMIRKPLQDKTAIEHFLAQIPQSASVAASNNLGSHLSHRETIYSIPIGTTTADYVTFLLDRNSLPPRYEQEVMILALRNNPEYELIVEQSGFFLFQRRHPLAVK
jgi:hypothetical protein